MLYAFEITARNWSISYCFLSYTCRQRRYIMRLYVAQGMWRTWKRMRKISHHRTYHHKSRRIHSNKNKSKNSQKRTVSFSVFFLRDVRKYFLVHNTVRIYYALLCHPHRLFVVHHSHLLTKWKATCRQNIIACAKEEIKRQRKTKRNMNECGVTRLRITTSWQTRCFSHFLFVYFSRMTLVRIIVVLCTCVSTNSRKTST